MNLARFPSYVDSRDVRRFVREGDVVLLNISGQDILFADNFPAPYIVHEISYGESEGKTTLLLSRDNLFSAINDSLVGTISDRLNSLDHRANVAGFAGSTPSERSASQIIWHETVGEFRPEGRMKFYQEKVPLLDVDGDEETDNDGNVIMVDGQSFVDYDDFIGEPSRDITPSDNWQTNLRIKQDGGGAVLFRGLPDGATVQEALNDFVPRGNKGGDAVGGLLHNSTTGFINASVPESVQDGDLPNPKRRLQNLLAGEWGVESPDAGSLTIPSKPTSTDSASNLPSYITLPSSGDVYIEPNLDATNEIIINRDTDRGVSLFDNVYFGGESVSTNPTNINPPMILFTPDASSTEGQVFLPHVEEWIRIVQEEDDEGTITSSYYYIGCIIRFATVVLARSINSGRDNSGNITPQGGLYNVQATSDGQLVIPQAITDGSSTTIHGVYQQFGDTTNITRPPYASYVVFARY